MAKTKKLVEDVCVMDFGGSYNMKDGTRIYPFNCCADWSAQDGVTRFGGAYRDVPDMPASKKPPTEAAVERWVKKHWKEEEWYPKYLKALEESEK